jgi:hypothetical protein
LNRFSILFAGVVSNFVYYPRKKNRKSAKIILKIDEALNRRQTLTYERSAMRRWICIFAMALLCAAQGFGGDDLDEYKRDTDALWRRGVGAEDGAFTAISLSMLGWGVGLAAGIGILASVLHQSTASAHTESSTAHCCN